MLEIISVMKPVEYRAGAVVIKQGDVGHELFIVDHGEFQCSFA